MENTTVQIKRNRPPIEWACLLYFLAAALPQPLAHVTVWVFKLFNAQADPGVISMTATAVYQLLILGLPGILYMLRHRESAPSMRLKAPRVGLIFGAAALAIAGTLLANNVGIWWMLLIDALGGKLQPSAIEIPTTARTLMQSFLLVGIMPGVCEELFFRGMMFGSWEQKSQKAAWIVSSVLFGVLHGNLQGLPVHLFMGFVLGYLLLRSGSLYVSMTFHAVYNSFTLLLAYFSQQTGGADPAVIENLSGYIEQSVGYFALLQSTISSVAMFMGIMMLQHIKFGRVHLKAPAEKCRLNRQAWVLLAGVLIFIGLLWFNEITQIW